LIGDFYLQADRLARNKQIHAQAVFIHSLLYVIPFIILLTLLSLSLDKMGIAVLVLGISHFLVDIVSRKLGSFTAFLVDQSIHVGILVGLAILLPLDVDLPASVIGVGFAVLLIFKPSSVIVSKILSSLASEEAKEGQGTIHAGYKIGYLERLIILLLCLFGAIASCTLVIAAKTLVRYAEFSNNNAFREVFLVGTLMSITLALIGYGVARFMIGL